MSTGLTFLRETLLSIRAQKALLAEVKPQLAKDDLTLFLTEMIPKIFEKTDSLTLFTLLRFKSDYEGSLKKARASFFSFTKTKEITSLQKKIEILEKTIAVAQRVLEEERREGSCGRKAWRLVCMLPKGGNWLLGKTLLSAQKAWSCLAFSAKLVKSGVFLLPRSVAWVWQHTAASYLGKCCGRTKEKVILEKALLKPSSVLVEKREESKESKEEKKKEKGGFFDRSFICMAQSLVHTDSTKDFGMSTALKWLFAIVGDTKVEKISENFVFQLANEEYSVVLKKAQNEWKNNKIPLKKFEGKAAEAKIRELFSSLLLLSSSCDVDLCRFIIDKIIPPNIVSYTIWADGSFALQYNKAHETTFHMDEKSGCPRSVDVTLNATATIQGKADFYSGAITFEKQAFSISKWGASAEIASVQLDAASDVTLNLRFSGLVSVAESLLRVKPNSCPTLTPNQFRAIFSQVAWS